MIATLLERAIPCPLHAKLLGPEVRRYRWKFAVEFLPDCIAALAGHVLLILVNKAPGLWQELCFRQRLFSGDVWYNRRTWIWLPERSGKGKQAPLTNRSFSAISPSPTMAEGVPVGNVPDGKCRFAE